MREILLAAMGELVLKGGNRRVFEGALLKTLRRRLADLGGWRVWTAQSAVYMEPRDAEADVALPEAFRRCLRVFGLAAVCRAAVCEKDFGAMCACAGEYLAPQLALAASFKVTARRADKTFRMDSMEIGREMGGYLLERFPHLGVRMDAPELVVTAEVREDAAYIHGGKRRGAGGLPVPTGGRAALLLSGGIDSPVAAHMMAKRGLALVPVHFASPPYTSPRAAEKVLSLVRQIAQYAGPMPYHCVRYTQTQEYLRGALARQEYFTVLMRRSMLRIAHAIAQRERCDALVTGESLAQVASQTLAALACTDAAQPLPVLRPCVGMDKTEITETARRIGTYEISVLPFEDCCTIFTPPHPKTRPRLDEVRLLEEGLPLLGRHEAQAAESTEFNLVMP